MGSSNQEMDVLAAKLVARALHDVAGPTSGLTAALDLLGDTGGDEALRLEALDLARESLRQIGEKIAFCRAAFCGNGGVDGATLDHLVQTPFARGRARLETPPIPAEAPPCLQPSVLILSLIASESLAAGGEARITLSQGPGLWSLGLAAEGARARLSPETRRGLQGEAFTEGLPGRWAPARHLSALVTGGGGELKVAAQEGRIAVSITLPG